MRHLLDWLFPQYCCLCDQLFTAGSTLCTDCYRDLPWNTQACQQCALPVHNDERLCGGCLSNPPAFTRCLAPFHYAAPISRLIVQLKFQHQLGYAKILGQLLADSLHSRGKPWPECILPVPLHYQRLQRRGFNQALEIAKSVSKALNIPILYDYCIRRKPTLPQSQLSATARRNNLRAAFSVQKPIPFQHVAILDDVITTGQTLRVFANTLRQHHVSIIDAWCCARAA